VQHLGWHSGHLPCLELLPNITSTGLLANNSSNAQSWIDRLSPHPPPHTATHNYLQAQSAKALPTPAQGPNRPHHFAINKQGFIRPTFSLTSKNWATPKLSAFSSVQAAGEVMDVYKALSLQATRSLLPAADPPCPNLPKQSCPIAFVLIAGVSLLTFNKPFPWPLQQ
jgi:hypothetical protein